VRRGKEGRRIGGGIRETRGGKNGKGECGWRREVVGRTGEGGKRVGRGRGRSKREGRGRKERINKREDTGGNGRG